MEPPSRRARKEGALPRGPPLTNPTPTPNPTTATRVLVPHDVTRVHGNTTGGEHSERRCSVHLKRAPASNQCTKLGLVAHRYILTRFLAPLHLDFSKATSQLVHAHAESLGALTRAVSMVRRFRLPFIRRSVYWKLGHLALGLRNRAHLLRGATRSRCDATLTSLSSRSVRPARTRSGSRGRAAWARGRRRAGGSRRPWGRRLLRRPR